MSIAKYAANYNNQQRPKKEMCLSPYYLRLKAKKKKGVSGRGWTDAKRGRDQVIELGIIFKETEDGPGVGQDAEGALRVLGTQDTQGPKACHEEMGEHRPEQRVYEKLARPHLRPVWHYLQTRGP